jgi:hypothetical protein
MLIHEKSGLFVQPKYAKFLDKEAIYDVMGKPSAEQATHRHGEMLPHPAVVPAVQGSSSKSSL